MLSNKGEVQIALNRASSGFDPQAAVAVSDHIGIMANGSFKSTDSDTTDDFHKHNFGEIGVGYYTKFQRLGRFEVFGGYGFGKVNVKTTWNVLGNTNSNIADVVYHRVFIQPSFGVTTNFFDMSFTPRIVLVHMKPAQYIYKTITRPFIEPVVTIKLGYKYFFFTSQFGVSLPMFNQSDQEWFEWTPVILSVGIQFKFGKIYDTQPSYN